MIALLVTALGAVGFASLSVFVKGSAYWACYWLYWFCGVFLVPECYWVINNPRFTLSEETWRFEDLNMRHPYDVSHWTAVHWTFAIVYLLFMADLGVHLIFGRSLLYPWH